MPTRDASGHVLELDRLSAADEARSGAKAWNCARLRQAGFRVPDGIVVLAGASDVEVERLPTHSWFDRQPEDARFAVRSSGIGEDTAGESFAGIHQTLLNVTREGVAAAARACRASAASAQAVAYRRARGLTGAVQMGVLVQRMVRAVAAGVAFSVNPVSGRDDEVVINASWGLGEELVSGLVDPDEFVLAKSDGAMRWCRVGDKRGDRTGEASLAPEQVHELLTVVIDIERHYGAAQDIEWCRDGSAFWVVQSRPVTTGHVRESDIEWTRANLAEVLPDMTSPQALAMFEVLLDRAERRFLGRLMAPESQLGPMVKAFLGRLHFNLSQMRRVTAAGAMPAAALLRSIGHSEAIRPEDEKAPPPSLMTLTSLPSMLRLAWMHLTAGRVVARHDAAAQTFLERFGNADTNRLSDEEMWQAVESWVKDAPALMETVLLLSGVLFHEMPVKKACEKAGMPYEALVYPQLAAGERSVSAQQAFDLVALADAARGDSRVAEALHHLDDDPSRWRSSLQGTRFLGELHRFLERYGHRGRFEYDWALPRYREDPSSILHAVRLHLEADAPAGPGMSGGTPAGTATRAAADAAAAEAWAAFEAKLSPWQRLTLLPRVRQGVSRIKQYYVWRERVRSDAVKVIGALRTWLLVVADRFVERGWLDRRDDFFLIRLDEIGEVIRGRRAPETLRALAGERLAERERHSRIEMPLLMRESQLPDLIRRSAVTGHTPGNVLHGHPVSRGIVEAAVAVIRDPADFSRMTRGAILVTRATDPSWTPLFTLASGVIVEVGGVLSHASTIAREYGIPALANVKHATRRLRTGERVRLDAVEGVVTKLSPDAGESERAAAGDEAVAPLH